MLRSFQIRPKTIFRASSPSPAPDTSRRALRTSRLAPRTSRLARLAPRARRHPDGAAHDARRRDRALPRPVSGDGVDRYGLHLLPLIRRRRAQTAGVARYGPRSSSHRSTDAQAPECLGEAARSVLQEHDASPSQGRLHLRLSRPRPVRRDDQAAPRAQDESVSAHPGGGRTRHRELLEGRDGERLW